VIIINVYCGQCDVLALCSGKQPLHIPLNISHTHIMKMTGILHDYLMENHVKSRSSSLELRGGCLTISNENSVSKISTVLHDLWKNVIKPIFNALDSSVCPFLYLKKKILT